MQELLFVSSKVFLNIREHHLCTFRHLSFEDYLALKNEILVDERSFKQNAEMLEDEFNSVFLHGSQVAKYAKVRQSIHILLKSRLLVANIDLLITWF